jgi:hypothetical protein
VKDVCNLIGIKIFGSLLLCDVPSFEVVCKSLWCAVALFFMLLIVLYLFPGDAHQEHLSLGLLFLYHFHNNSKTCCPHGRPVLASAILLGRRGVPLILLWQTGQHHLPMLVSLVSTTSSTLNLTLPMVVVEWTTQSMYTTPILTSRTRKRCCIVGCLYLI